VRDKQDRGCGGHSGFSKNDGRSLAILDEVK
jgi:hypothetical protein